MILDRFRLDGKVAVVTGGGRAIGLACATALAEAGARVTILDQDPEVLAAGLSSLPVAEGIRTDVTQTQEIEAAADAILARHGRLDIAVNCAGIGRRADGETTTDEEWRQVMAVNLDGNFYSCRAFGRRMLAQGSGSIVNIGSMAGDIVVRPQNNVHYNASKAGVHHVTRSLAAEWAARGVRVNAIAPGFIDTPMNAYAIAQDPEMAAMWLKNTPMARYGRVDEIASVALFLASDAASFMTGAIVTADGGYTVW